VFIFLQIIGYVKFTFSIEVLLAIGKRAKSQKLKAKSQQPTAIKDKVKQKHKQLAYHIGILHIIDYFWQNNWSFVLLSFCPFVVLSFS